MLEHLLTVGSVALCVCPALAQDRTALEPGEVSGTITEAHPAVRSRILGTPGYSKVSRGELYALTVPSSGPWTIQLESEDFDAFLVLRDAEGVVLAEDDDGSIPPNAQLVVDLEADRVYHLDACALHRGGGSFVLRVEAGNPIPLTPEERYATALESLRAALAANTRNFGPYHPTTVATLEQLAWQLWWQGHYSEVVELLRPLLAACELLRGPEHPDTARCLRHLADSLGRTGAFEEAEEMHRRALAIREKAFGPDSALTFDSLCALAGHLVMVGREEEAESFVQRARNLARDADGAELANNLEGLLLVARHLRENGRLEEAESFYRQAIAGPGQGHALPYEPSLLLGLARTVLDQGRIEEAETLFREACTAISEHWGARHPSLIGAYGGLAQIALERGDPGEAHRLRVVALDLARGVYGEDHIFTAGQLQDVAHALLRMGDLDAAVPLYARALEIRAAKLGAEHFVTAQSRRLLALRMLDLGRAEEGWELAHEATTDAQARLTEIFAECSETDRFRYAAAHAWAIDTLISLTAAAPDTAREVAAYEALIRWKGVVFRTLAQHVAPEEAEQNDVLDELRRVRRRLSRLLYEDADRALTEPPGTITALLDRRTELESTLSRMKAGGESESRMDLDAIAAALPARGVYVDFHLGRRYTPARRATALDPEVRSEPGEWSPLQLTAWIVRPDRSLTRVDLGPAEPIQSALELYLEDLVSRRGVATEEAGRVPGVSLRELLWTPVARQLGDAELVFLCPDGFLGCLPFETLQEADGRYLVEKLAFVYIQDAESLVRWSRLPARSAPVSILALGGVDYDDSEHEQGAEMALAMAANSPLRGGLQEVWLPLSETGREAEGILHLAKLFLDEGIERIGLSGSAATEERLEQAMPGRSVLHLATHGFLQPAGVSSLWAQAKGQSAPEQTEVERERRLLSGQFPALLSGLVLAGANLAPAQDGEDGLLTADEIAWLDLGECQLVVLSACETGLGTEQAGEGMFSLRRAFHQAGARTAVSSLWRVRDYETMELMTAFYRRLWKEGASPLEALRQSQLEMLNQNRARFRGEGRPSTWGAFVLSGDWR